jgi:hypothetical protein
VEEASLPELKSNNVTSEQLALPWFKITNMHDFLYSFETELFIE